MISGPSISLRVTWSLKHVGYIGEPDIIEVRQMFETVEKAIEFEEKVIDKLDAVRDSRWLNQQNAGRKFNNDGVSSIRKTSYK